MARGSQATRRAPPPAQQTANAIGRLRSSAPARLAVAHPDATAALLLGLVVLVYLWPALVGGQLLSPLSTLYVFAPWRGFAPHDVASYYNELLTDVPMVDYPWRFLVRQLLREGTFPAWDPYVFAGTPLFSNPQTGLFSLFDVPEWVLPFHWAIGFAAALKLWIAGLGTYLLARRLRLGVLPGLLAGVGFAFCSLNVVWLTHETLPAVAALLPWMVLCVERLFERRRLADALWLAVATAIALGGGHPGMQLHVVVVVALYALLRAALIPDADAGRWLRPLALVGGGLALGLLLMAVMLVPEAVSSHGTIGTAARTKGELPGSHLGLGTIRTLLFPDWWGRPSAGEARPRGVTNYNERTLYAGVVVALLACVALVARDGWRRKAPFVALAFLGLAVPLHAPVLHWLFTRLPLLDLVQAQRLHFAYEFGAAILAAYGLQALLDRPQERARLAVPGVALGVGAIAIVGAGAGGADFGHVVKHFLTGADFTTPGVLALTSVVWYVLFVLGVGLALLAVRRWPQRRAAIAAGVVLLAVLDALHFAHGYQPMGPPSKVVPPRTPAIAYLQRHAAGGRFVGIEFALLNDWSLTYGLHDVRGYDPPQPTQRFYDLWRAVNPEQVDWQTFTIPAPTPEAVNLVSVLGARYLVAVPGVQLADARSPPLRDVRRVFGGRDATVFRDERALPRAFVAGAVEVTGSVDATRARLLEPTFDPRRAVVVERSEPGVAALAAEAHGAAPAGTVTVARERNASVTLHATLARRGLVVLDDNFTDGWSVRVDGRPATALHVDDVVRGVIVPAGRHEVVWSYRVPGLRAGAAISLLALALLLGAAGVLAVGRRRAGAGD